MAEPLAISTEAWLCRSEWNFTLGSPFDLTARRQASEIACGFLAAPYAGRKREHRQRMQFGPLNNSSASAICSAVDILTSFFDWAAASRARSYSMGRCGTRGRRSHRDRRRLWFARSAANDG